MALFRGGNTISINRAIDAIDSEIGGDLAKRLQVLIRR